MKKIGLLMVCWVMLGCVPLLKAPGSSRVFNLQAPMLESRKAPDKPLQLTVEELTAGGALQSNRIVVYADPLELRYLAGAQWSERATQLWQRLMVESIETTGHFRSVSVSGQALKTELSLVGELQRFQAEVRGSSTVTKVRLSLKLVDNPSLKVRAQRTFEAEAETRESGIDGIVDGLDRATQRVLLEVAAWVVEQT